MKMKRLKALGISALALTVITAGSAMAFASQEPETFAATMTTEAQVIPMEKEVSEDESAVLTMTESTETQNIGVEITVSNADTDGEVIEATASIPATMTTPTMKQ